MTLNQQPQWGTIREAADELRLSTKTIRRYIDQGILDAIRIGDRTIRIDMHTVRAVGRRMREYRNG